MLFGEGSAQVPVEPGRVVVDVVLIVHRVDGFVIGRVDAGLRIGVGQYAVVEIDFAVGVAGRDVAGDVVDVDLVVSVLVEVGIGERGERVQPFAVIPIGPAVAHVGGAVDVEGIHCLRAC